MLGRAAQRRRSRSWKTAMEYDSSSSKTAGQPITITEINSTICRISRTLKLQDRTGFQMNS
eukprot:3622417-Pleurochrysis_carterae.AAC.1